MAELRNEKYVNALPATLIANTIYYVKNGANFNMYITNNNGTIIAYPLNTSSTTWKKVELNIPFPAKYQYTLNIVDTEITLASIIDLKLDSTIDTDENDSELYELNFNTKCNIGSLDVTINSKDQNVFGGKIKIIYKIN